MKKYKNLIIILAVIIIGVVAFLYYEQQQTNKRVIEIPKQSTVDNIKISKNYSDNYKEFEDKKVIADIYSALMQTKRVSSKESVHDVPQNADGDVKKIVIDIEDEGEAVIYVYKAKDGKYYVERPYEGIYEIREQYYNELIKY